MRDTANWFILFLIGVLLIVIGIQGSLGKMLACILIPSKVSETA